MRKVLPLLALLAVASFASDPRLTVLGGDARLLVNDYLEMWAYPGNIGDYQFVTGGSETAGNTSDGWFGAAKDFDGQTFGVTINHTGYSHEILYSPGDWGAILSFDFDKFAPDSISTQKDMEVGLAWGTDVAILADHSDLALMVTYDKSSLDENDYETSETDLMFGGSLRGHGNDFMNLFPIITASVDMYTNDLGDLGEFSETSIYVDFGAGHNKNIAEKTRLVFGAFAGLQSTSFGGDYEDVDSQMWMHVPRLTGGVEQMVGKWLIFRAGATSENVYYSSGDFNQFSTDFETWFGLGLHWDNFTLDGTIGEGFLHDGPYMVGGDANGFLSSVSATYSF